MRLRQITITLTLILLASGVFAVPALAGDPSVKSLKQRLRHAKQLRLRAHDRLAAAAADLAAAREYVAATTTEPAPTPEATPSPTVTPDAAPSPAVSPDAATTTAEAPVAIPTLMQPGLAADLLADGIVTSEEISSLEARLTVAKRAVRRWNLRVRRLQRRLDVLQQIAAWNRDGRWRPLIAVAAARYHVSADGLYRMMMLESGGRRTVGATYKGLFQYYTSTWSGTWNPWRHESIYNGWAQIRATAYAIGRGMGPSQWPNTYPMAF